MRCHVSWAVASSVQPPGGSLKPCVRYLSSLASLNRSQVKRPPSSRRNPAPRSRPRATSANSERWSTPSLSSCLPFSTGRSVPPRRETTVEPRRSQPRKALGMTPFSMLKTPAVRKEYWMPRSKALKS